MSSIFSAAPGTDCTLGTLAHWAFNGDDELFEVDTMSTEKSAGIALMYWYALNSCLMDKRRSPRLEAVMTKGQKRSYQLLLDWWTAAYQDPAASLAFILDITKRAPELSEPSDVIEYLRLRRWPSGDIEEPPARTPYDKLHCYHEALKLLFETEFLDMGMYGDTSEQTLTLLGDYRDSANATAYAQQAAMRCYDIASQHVDKVLELPSHEGLISSGAMDVSLPTAVAKLDPGTTQSLKLGPYVNACPWLKADDGMESRKEWPYYLWDINARRTVVTEELENLPAYTTISHTWGRWADADKPRVQLRGVPWSIPYNTLFDVASIPDELASAHVPTRYVWLDLVCIPQDFESQIAIREIARQGVIFRNSQRAIAWFHDAADMACLSAMFRWCALSLLRFAPDSIEGRRVEAFKEREWKSISQRQSGLFIPRAGAMTVESHVLNPWFTSLWTLQELCLRPDMWIASSKWDLLCIGDGTPVPINGLTTVYRAFETQCERYFPEKLWTMFSDHSAMYELKYCVYSTGLSRLHELSIVDILGYGDQRHCQSRRSEAIMSALGTTDWFSLSDHSSHESNLILGKYHPDFIAEVRRAIPGEFFASPKKTTLMSHDLSVTKAYEGESDEQPLDQQDLMRHRRGSLLPFSSTGIWISNSGRAELADFRVCDSVRGWTIQPSGDVCIRQADILSSSFSLEKQRPEVMPCVFDGFETEITSEPKVETMLEFDLHQWTRTRSYGVYAVVVMSSTVVKDWRRDKPGTVVYRAMGVILRVVEDSRLFKIGNFFAYYAGHEVVAETFDVDWTVL